MNKIATVSRKIHDDMKTIYDIFMAGPKIDKTFNINQKIVTIKTINRFSVATMFFHHKNFKYYTIAGIRYPQYESLLPLRINFAIHDSFYSWTFSEEITIEQQMDKFLKYFNKQSTMLQNYLQQVIYHLI